VRKFNLGGEGPHWTVEQSKKKKKKKKKTRRRKRRRRRRRNEGDVVATPYFFKCREAAQK
jgi:hypothetical protein